MRKKIDTVQQLNDFLWNHKAVKAALREEASNRKRKSKGSKTKINSSNPKEWIRAATSLDPKIGALINATRRVCECQKEGRAQLRKKVLRKGKKTLDPKYLYKWAGIERDYHTMANLSYELIASNPLIAGFARAAKDIDDVHRFANPAFLDIPHTRLLKELGVDLDEFSDLYRFAYLPTKNLVEAKLRSRTENTSLTEGQKNVGKLAFLYAPERLMEMGALKLSGSDPVSLSIAIATVAVSIAWYQEQLRQLAAAMNNANVFLLLLLWIIWNDQQNKLDALIKTHSQLQNQYDQEMAQVAQENTPVSNTAGQNPQSVASEFNYVIGNMSRTKREVHLPNCGFLHLIRPDHLRTFQTLALARSTGLDNCYYCIGGSTR